MPCCLLKSHLQVDLTGEGARCRNYCSFHPLALKTSSHARHGTARLEGGVPQVIHQWQPSDDSEARRQLQRQLMPLAMMSRNAEDMQQDVTYAAEILLGGNLTWTPTSDHQFVQSASQGHTLQFTALKHALRSADLKWQCILHDICHLAALRCESYAPRNLNSVKCVEPLNICNQ